jgi:DNA-binding transcriptional LysR family regulator
MRTEQLHYFSLAYETRSYAAAARRVPMSKTGFVKALDSLSRALGCDLFVQDGSGLLTPTEYADEVYSFVCQFDSLNELLNNRLSRIHARQSNTIRFGSAQGILAMMGPDFLSKFYRQNQGVGIDFNEYNDLICEEALLNELLDLAFTVFPYHKKLVTTELHSEKICFWIPTSNPLSTKECLVADDFAGMNVAIPGRGFKCYELLLDSCAQAGVSLGEIYECSQLYRIFEYVVRGCGIGFTLPSVAAMSSFKNNTDIVCVPSSDLTHRFGISYKPTHSLSKLEQKLYNYCIDWVTKLEGNHRSNTGDLRKWKRALPPGAAEIKS